MDFEFTRAFIVFVGLKCESPVCEYDYYFFFKELLQQAN